MKRILCYGDSNTYGYDPRGLLALRYPTADIWTSVAEQLLEGEFEITNQGFNGRELPTERDHRLILEMMSDLRRYDLFVTMLGTNDILLVRDPDAETAIRKMEDYLFFLEEVLDRRAEDWRFTPLLIAPPYIKEGFMGGESYHQECIRMNEGFRRLAEEHGAWFFDAADWKIDLAFDHVHFSPKGHRAFAKRFASELALYLNRIRRLL